MILPGRPLPLAPVTRRAAIRSWWRPPPPCSDEELSKQRRRQRPACAAECSKKIGRAIRRQSLQGLQQRRNGHEGSPDCQVASSQSVRH